MGVCEDPENTARSEQPTALKPGIGASFLVSPKGEVYFQTGVPHSACWDAMQKGELIEGDVLVEVDGQRVYRVPIRLVAQMLQGTPGSFVRVSFRRNTQEFTLDLERRLLGPVVSMEKKTFEPSLGTHSASSSSLPFSLIRGPQASRKGRKKYKVESRILDSAEVGQEFYADMADVGTARLTLDQLTEVHHTLQASTQDKSASRHRHRRTHKRSHKLRLSRSCTPMS